MPISISKAVVLNENMNTFIHRSSKDTVLVTNQNADEKKTALKINKKDIGIIKKLVHSEL